MAFVGILSQIKLLFGLLEHSACVAYTKIIIHLGVGESGGYIYRAYLIDRNRSSKM